MQEAIRTNPKDFTELRRTLVQVVRRLPNNKVAHENLAQTASLADVIEVVNKILEVLR